MLVSGDVDLKEVIMESLRNLINSCEDLAPLQKFSNYFMSRLCSVYQVGLKNLYIVLNTSDLILRLYTDI